MTGTALILGARGRFGRHAAMAFETAGWTVRRFRRDQDDLTQSAMGADVIVNGWNPTYDKWQAELAGLSHQVVAAARASGATVLQAGNLYVYGADAPARLDADTPHAAANPMGQWRIESEEILRRSGVQVILLRAGDFLDTEASGNWFDMMMAPSLRKGALQYPGDPRVAHAWSFLPDVARAAVALAEKRADLPRITEVPFAGYTLTGEELGALCAQAIGQAVRVKPMNWLPIRLARPFWSLAPRLLEMRYLWWMPHGVSADAMNALLPGFVETPASEAVAQAVRAALATKDRAKPARGDRRRARAA